MLPTPDLSHLTSKDYDLVYEPAEDTFLLLDALEADLEALKEVQPRVCLEIGSGSGCVSTFLAQILGPSSAVYLCTDINPHANRATRATGRQNQAELDVVNGAFALPIRRRLQKTVDIILFNPPYVPTSFEEAQMSQNQGDIGGAWAGGWDGMEVTNQFLDQVEELLSEKGRFYLVALKQNGVPEIRERMLERFELKSEVPHSLYDSALVRARPSHQSRDRKFSRPSSASRGLSHRLGASAMTVKSIPTLPAYPSSATRKSISPSQLSTLNGSINSALSAVLAKGISAAGTSQAFIQSYAQDHAFTTLQSLIWDNPPVKSLVEKAIHTKVLQLSQTLADHGLLGDIKLLVDLAIVYGRGYPSKIRALFEKVAEKSGDGVIADIRASLVPSFTQILETGHGLYNQRKAVECIYCFILASSTSPTLLAPFARDNKFYTALARLYLPGLSTTARSYGGAHALLSAISNTTTATDPTEWTAIYLSTKVTILDTLHVLLKRLLTDLTSSDGPSQLAARTEVTFGAVFAMMEVAADPNLDAPGSSATPPTPFLNYSLLQDYQNSHDLSALLGRALQKAQERDARLDLLESALASVSSGNAPGPKKKDPGALKILIRGSGLAKHAPRGFDARSSTSAAYHDQTPGPSLASTSVTTAPTAGSSADNDLELTSKASQVLDLFPDFSFEYATALLKSSKYGGNVERVIEALLEGSAPSEGALAEEAASAPQHVLKPAPEFIPAANRAPAVAAAAPTVGSERRNVFDTEIVDFTSVRFGKKNVESDVAISDRDRLLREEMKADILRRVEIMDLESDEDEDEIDPFALVDAADAAPSSAKEGKKRAVYEDDDDDDLDLDDAAIRVAGADAEDTESDDDSVEIITSQDTAGSNMRGITHILELAYLADPSVFGRSALTRRSKARADLRAQTGWADEQIEGWAIVLEKNPKRKDKLLLKHEFRGNRHGDEEPMQGEGHAGTSGSGPQRGGGRGGRGGRGGGGGGGGRGGRGRGGGGGGGRGGQGGGEGGDRAHKDRNKASQGNHNRKRGHDKKMARAGGPS